MKQTSGFSLVQISILLIIIGLIAGGVLVGQNLINAAAISAQISQVQKYQTAVNLFQTKYNGYLPGDIPNPYATNFGFIARATAPGQGDGNGIIEGNCSGNPNGNSGFYPGCGELAVFWVDLSTAGLIDSNIAALGGNYPRQWPPGITITLSSTPNLNAWLPPAKLGQGNFVYLYSYAGINYFTVGAITSIFWGLIAPQNPGLTVQQTFNIDSKIDDGLPQSGSVQACYTSWNVANGQAVWAAGGGLQGANGGANCTSTTAATPYASTNCYDNNGSAGVQTYSISKNANMPNCALSFQFQTQ